MLVELGFAERSRGEYVSRWSYTIHSVPLLENPLAKNISAPRERTNPAEQTTAEQNIVNKANFILTA